MSKLNPREDKKAPKKVKPEVVRKIVEKRLKRLKKTDYNVHIWDKADLRHIRIHVEGESVSEVYTTIFDDEVCAVLRLKL